MTGRRSLSIVAAVLLIVVTPEVARAGDWGAQAEDDAYVVNAFEAEAELRRSRSADPAITLVRYTRAPMCNVGTGGGVEMGDDDEAFGDGDTDGDGLIACGASNTTVPVPVCVDGPPLLPLWRQERADAAQPWPELWTLAFGYSCPEDAVPTMTAADFRRLPLAAPVLRLQPDRGWVLVNKETIVMTDPAEQTLRTDLLGYGVDVVATPASYRYDFGDGSADLVTTSPGHAWPDHDTFHFYERLGTVQVTLTTTWQGRYRVDGTTVWRDVNGTATTATTSAPFTVEERRSRLVDDLCTDIPRPDDC
ncbi:hypothetical protein OMK64_01490 [Cellulomonas fimi]|uniref:hypothetical protein n=1 Tax=Cellulomonas fimi TaxID=1708 RepID=UPI00234E1598|nr:hypothetical protein [Cellulomonas fimi]MDC7120205.1 hypothetical protein [Cellulomonas fimi]